MRPLFIGTWGQPRQVAGRSKGKTQESEINIFSFDLHSILSSSKNHVILPGHKNICVNCEKIIRMKPFFLVDFRLMLLPCHLGKA